MKEEKEAKKEGKAEMLEANNKSNIGIIILLTIIVIGLIGYICYSYGTFDNLLGKDSKPSQEESINNNDNNNETQVPEAVSNFAYDEASHRGYGTVQVTGYATVEKFSGFGDTWEYVFFNVLSSNNQDFMEYIKANSNNTFYHETAIGIGDLENNVIKRSNFSDELGLKEFNMSKEDSDKILNSSQNSPIKLNLEMLKDSNSHGEPPASYSPITYVEIAK